MKERFFSLSLRERAGVRRSCFDMEGWAHCQNQPLHRQGLRSKTPSPQPSPGGRGSRTSYS
jgi:hypothetical protein